MSLSNEFRPRKPYEFEDKNGCFVCTSHAFGRDGYPIVKRRGKMKRLSHVIYEECFGFLEDGQIILHKCDNPTCVNPEHLRAGTPQENSEDMKRKNRQARGSKNASAKLTEEDVINIRKMRNGGKTLLQIANKFNVSMANVSDICRRKVWKHV